MFVIFTHICHMFILNHQMYYVQQMMKISHLANIFNNKHLTDVCEKKTPDQRSHRKCFIKRLANTAIVAM